MTLVGFSPEAKLSCRWGLLPEEQPRGRGVTPASAGAARPQGSRCLWGEGPLCLGFIFWPRRTAGSEFPHRDQTFTPWVGSSGLPGKSLTPSLWEPLAHRVGPRGALLSCLPAALSPGSFCVPPSSGHLVPAGSTPPQPCILKLLGTDRPCLFLVGTSVNVEAGMECVEIGMKSESSAFQPRGSSNS